jgi:hypothetical protein
MYRSFRRAALAVALFSAVVGCTRSMVQNKPQPPDPLLVSKKPVEGKPSSYSAPPAQAPVFTAEETGRQEVPAMLSSELVVRPGR